MSDNQIEPTDRVHAELVWRALDCGMDSEQALRYADSRLDSIEGDTIRLQLAVADARQALLDSIDRFVARVKRP